MHNPKKQNQQGFTLVEIAIVFVIIGLLLSGVLKGQELIKNAKIKAAASDINAYSVALIGYQDRYGDLFANGINAKYIDTTVASTPSSAQMIKELANRGLISSKAQHALGGNIVIAKQGVPGFGTASTLAQSTTTTISPRAFNWAVCYEGISVREDIEALIRTVDGANSDFNNSPKAYETGRARLVNATLTSAPADYATTSSTVCFEI